MLNIKLWIVVLVCITLVVGIAEGIRYEAAEHPKTADPRRRTFRLGNETRLSPAEEYARSADMRWSDDTIGQMA